MTDDELIVVMRDIKERAVAAYTEARQSTGPAKHPGLWIALGEITAAAAGALEDIERLAKARPASMSLAQEVFNLVAARCQDAGLSPQDEAFRSLLVTMLEGHYALAGGGMALREAIFDALSESFRQADELLAAGEKPEW